MATHRMARILVTQGFLAEAVTAIVARMTAATAISTPCNEALLARSCSMRTLLLAVRVASMFKTVFLILAGFLTQGHFLHDENHLEAKPMIL